MKANGYFEFLAFFEELPDPRHDRGQNHLLIDMVAHGSAQNEGMNVAVGTEG